MRSFMRIWGAVLAALVLLSASCGKQPTDEEAAPYDTQSLPEALPSGTVTENDRFSLIWDGESACIQLLEKSSGHIWSTTPYDYYSEDVKSGRAGILMGSPIQIEFAAKTNTSDIKSMYGYTGVIRNGRIGSRQIENGIRVTYYFDKIEIAVPVEYTLTQQGLQVALVPTEIEEHDNLVYAVSLAPFLCSARNSLHRIVPDPLLDDSTEVESVRYDPDRYYLFVPSGSGALMYTDERGAEGTARIFEDQVYGRDPARYQEENIRNTAAARLPLFGARDGDYALCGIIEEGAESAWIEAIAGDMSVGYSAAYATFRVRGDNISVVQMSNGGNQQTLTFSDDITGNKRFCVGYYPLDGDQATYAGMASLYRERLFGEKTEVVAERPLNLDILGALQIQSLKLGIPYRKTVAATTFEQAGGIIETVSQATDMPLSVLLEGFGSTGLDVGKVAGGYTFAAACGSQADLTALQSRCEQLDTELFVHFNMLQFSKTGAGFSSVFDTAKAANFFTAYQKFYSVALRNENAQYGEFVLLRRDKMGQAVDKLLKMADKYQLNGLSFDSLGSLSYSDYGNKAYYVGGGMGERVLEPLASIQQSGRPVALTEANAYAACRAQKLWDVPVYSSRYDSLDVDVPVYQMVFKGRVDTAVSPINTAVNARTQFLKALEGGSGLTFSLSADYFTDFAATRHSAMAVSLLKDNMDTIVSMSRESRAFYQAVSGASIAAHTLVNRNVRCTTFDNGVRLLVNYGTADYPTSDGTVPAHGFLMKG